MKYSFLQLTLVFSFLITTNTALYAQTTKEEVLKPIYLLFEGMEKADVSIIKKACAKNVIMKVVSEQGIKEEKFDEFLTAIANKNPNSPKWIEKLYNTEVRIDGNLAHVWTDYSFYVGDQFSHCGVDSFALIKLDGIWKIVYIMDTRREEDCEEK